MANHDALNPHKITARDIRVWTLVMAAALTVVGLAQYFFWGHVRAATILWILAAAFLLPGLTIPMALKPLYKLWIRFALALAWFNTRLILSLTYFLIFTPIGLILRLLGKDLIKEKWDPQAATYWIDRPQAPFDPARYEKQY
ncbi:MAG: hypothetical protein C4524_10025 [Candidatus Zixiibacteriota bacterium]|nr:MAG: hypothetical protein C4524_10025 [candidate division Zixibacteria bacterium]